MKYLKVFSIIMITMILCSCSSGKTASDHMELYSPSITSQTKTTATTAPLDTAIRVEEDYLDLTGMSSTMVYAQLYGISIDPDSYEGKTLRMRGQFCSVYVEEEDTRYYACYVLDDTGCCMQGFEFVADDLIYPDDYPEEDAYFTVSGTIELYEKDGQLYRHLVDASIELE